MQNIHTVNNDNDIVRVNTTYNDNDIVKGNTAVNSNFDKSKQVEAIALKLVGKLGSEDSYKFYCKVAYKLPEHKIWNNLETALNGRSPGALFNWLCRRDMGSLS